MPNNLNIIGGKSSMNQKISYQGFGKSWPPNGVTIFWLDRSWGRQSTPVEILLCKSTHGVKVFICKITTTTTTEWKLCCGWVGDGKNVTITIPRDELGWVGSLLHRLNSNRSRLSPLTPVEPSLSLGRIMNRQFIGSSANSPLSSSFRTHMLFYLACVSCP